MLDDGPTATSHVQPPASGIPPDPTSKTTAYPAPIVGAPVGSMVASTTASSEPCTVAQPEPGPSFDPVAQQPSHTRPNERHMRLATASGAYEWIWVPDDYQDPDDQMPPPPQFMNAYEQDAEAQRAYMNIPIDPDLADASCQSPHPNGMPPPLDMTHLTPQLPTVELVPTAKGGANKGGAKTASGKKKRK